MIRSDFCHGRLALWMPGRLSGRRSRCVVGSGGRLGHESIGRTQPASLEHRFSQMLSIWCYTSIRSIRSMAMAGRVEFSDPKKWWFWWINRHQPGLLSRSSAFGSRWPDLAGLPLGPQSGFLKQLHRVHSSSHRRYVMYIYMYTLVYIIWYMYICTGTVYIYIWELKFYKTCWTLSFLLQGLQMVMQHGSLRSPKSTMPSLASKSACWSWNWRNPQRIVSFFWSQWNIYIYMYIYYYISYKISTWYIITPPYFHAIFSLLSTYSHDFPTPNHGFYRDSFLFFLVKT